MDDLLELSLFGRNVQLPGGVLHFLWFQAKSNKKVSINVCWKVFAVNSRLFLKGKRGEI